MRKRGPACTWAKQNPPPTRCIDHFWEHGIRLANGCLEWNAGTDTNGYGKVKDRERHIRAHIHAYTLATGARPVLPLDHKCHNTDPDCPGGKSCRHRRCIEPTHLEEVTQPVNLHRSPHWSGNRTHCKNGHPLSGSNLLNTASDDRICRECHRLQRATYVAAHREEINKGKRAIRRIRWVSREPDENPRLDKV